MFIVETLSKGERYFLKSTTWTSARERATEFQDEQAAEEGLERARKFMKAAAYKAARVVRAA